ncbi:MAG: class I SAM-dependent methyltransferase [Syntrophobacteraceae bacterium]|nr:class I SAM-dependent methyltransferase [Syntrophobacteraceae bacterium]
MEKSYRVYEQLASCGLTKAPLRPGGLDLTTRALSLCPFPPGARILDVGCGTGATVAYLSTHCALEAVGLDPSAFLLISGHRRGAPLNLVQGAGEHLPFGDRQWDGVVMECTLSVVEDADVVLAECARVLKRDGFLILSDVYLRNPCVNPLLTAAPVVSCLTGATDMDELERRLTDNGFKILFWEDHSRALKEFAAELILSGISLEVPGMPCARKNTAAAAKIQITDALAKARPGYYLLIAGRPERLNCSPQGLPSTQSIKL